MNWFDMAGHSDLRKRVNALQGFPRRLSFPEVLLLRAALLEGPAAVSAHESFHRHFKIDIIEPTWQRLMPQLHENLLRLGISSPVEGRLHGIRRYVWVRNLKLMKLAQRVFSAIEVAGVPHLILKGAAIVACYLKDRSLRPMDDIDILIPSERLTDVARALAEIEIAPQFTTVRSLIDKALVRAPLPGWPFVGGGQNIDIHWNAMHLDRRLDADHEFWKQSHRVRLDGLEISVLNPAHQLLHVIAHAAQTQRRAPLQWVSDAALIIRGTRSLSWDKFVDAAYDHRLSAVAADAIAFLSEIIELPIPATIVTRLRAKSSWDERIEERIFAIGPRRRLNPLVKGFMDYQEFRRGPIGLLTKPVATAFAPFIQSRAGTTTTISAALALCYDALGKPAWLRRFTRPDRNLRLPDRASLPEPQGLLRLSADGSSEAPFFRGWSIAEATGRWTVGSEASIAWQLNEPLAEMDLSIDAEPFLSKHCRHQVVDIWANDRRIASLRFKLGKPSPLHHVITLPKVVTAGRNLLVITFVIRRPRSPAELGLSEDYRTLGLFVRAVGFVH